ncbi:MAG TPA: FKBP-type peptidyl-prolyl cis-trans isomerase [Thermodesulfobacteriota bacterium]|jgi:FKBP-type peptidyl-prolyl cis-trans isomerase 2|nr:FKBP-type peptidyl-prolyl cis-trans isomerase [Thermodesulfobacteriota bacterium]
MAQAKEDDTVRVHYTVKLDNDTIVGSTKDEEPLQFTLGKGQVLPGFEQAVVGMNSGESKTVLVTADQGFGPYLDEMVVVVDRGRLPEELNPKEGDRIQLQSRSGETVTVAVMGVSESTITIDGNHPLAGKDLLFDIEFIEVVRSE